MSYALYIDAIRNPPPDDGINWKIARSAPEIFDILKEFGNPTLFSISDVDDLNPDNMRIAESLIKLDYDNFNGFNIDLFYQHGNPSKSDKTVDGFLSSYWLSKTL